jgi:uncharacterized protein (TIGR02996 family)
VSTTVKEVLLQDILANPDDDDLRRIYADWLEEHQQHARAELIRVQVRLALLSKSEPARQALERRERELLQEHAPQWLAEIGLRDREASSRQPALPAYRLAARLF